MIEAKVTPAESSNGYIATVEKDGVLVYNSEVVYPHHGVFPDAGPAQEHADAWAARLREIPGEIEDHKAMVALRTCEEGVILTGQIHEDSKRLELVKAQAKQFKASVEQRRERLEDIQAAPARADLKVVWGNRDDPSDVLVVPVQTVLDDCFEVYVEDDPRQLSIPQTNWVFTEDEDTGVSRVAGHGPVKMRREGDRLIITLGADEHEIVAELDGDVLHTRGRVEDDEKPALKPVEFACGKLKDKPLRDRLDMPEFTRPETIIGVYKLEVGRKPKPRKRVIAKLEELMQDHKTHEEDLVMAWTDIDAGRSPQMDVDRAAAAITTATDEELAEANDQWMEEAVAGCGDPLVLNWLIDGERERGDDARDHLITVATERLRALGEVVDGEAEVEAEAGDLDEVG